MLIWAKRISKEDTILVLYEGVTGSVTVRYILYYWYSVVG